MQTVVLRNRFGKKRKSTKDRLPGGRLSSRKPVEDVMAVALAQPHRKGLAAPRDQKAEWALGRLSLSGAISDLQFAAGNRYYRIVCQYRAAMDVYDSLAKVSGNTGNGITPEEYVRRLRTYDEAFACMPTRAAKAVKRLILPGEDLWPGGINDAKLGLDCLVKHFKITHA